MPYVIHTSSAVGGEARADEANAKPQAVGPNHYVPSRARSRAWPRLLVKVEAWRRFSRAEPRERAEAAA